MESYEWEKYSNQPIILSFEQSCIKFLKGSYKTMRSNYVGQDQLLEGITFSSIIWINKWAANRKLLTSKKLWWTHNTNLGRNFEANSLKIYNHTTRTWWVLTRLWSLNHGLELSAMVYGEPILNNIKFPNEGTMFKFT